jgi:hypothetical protein
MVKTLHRVTSSNGARFNPTFLSKGRKPQALSDQCYVVGVLRAMLDSDLQTNPALEKSLAGLGFRRDLCHVFFMPLR